MSRAGNGIGWEMIAKGTILVTLTLIIAAAIDIHQIRPQKKFAWQQEVKDELKDTEGRP